MRLAKSHCQTPIIAVSVAWWQLLNLSCCKNLKVFKLVIDSDGRTGRIPTLLPSCCLVILTYVPETVQKIVLCIRGSLAHHLEWSRLEQILLNYKGLRKVAVEPWVTPDTRNVQYLEQIQVEERLPKVRAKNLFEVVQ